MAGLTVRNPQTGAVVLSITDRITRIAGRVTITSAPGSLQIPQDSGSPFFYVPTTPTSEGMRVPPVTLNGWTLSWPSLSSMGPYTDPNSVNFDIVYGYY